MIRRSTIIAIEFMIGIIAGIITAGIPFIIIAGIIQRFLKCDKLG